MADWKDNIPEGALCGDCASIDTCPADAEESPFEFQCKNFVLSESSPLHSSNKGKVVSITEEAEEVLVTEEIEEIEESSKKVTKKAKKPKGTGKAKKKKEEVKEEVSEELDEDLDLDGSLDLGEPGNVDIGTMSEKAPSSDEKSELDGDLDLDLEDTVSIPVGSDGAVISEEAPMTEAMELDLEKDTVEPTSKEDWVDIEGSSKPLSELKSITVPLNLEKAMKFIRGYASALNLDISITFSSPK